MKLSYDSVSRTPSGALRNAKETNRLTTFSSSNSVSPAFHCLILSSLNSDLQSSSIFSGAKGFFNALTNSLKSVFFSHSNYSELVVMRRVSLLRGTDILVTRSIRLVLCNIQNEP